MLKKYLILLLSLIISNFNSQNYAQTKQGGICFRIDDNKSMDLYQEYANVFNQHELNFCFALNLGREEFESSDYIGGVKLLQIKGHELMDHTPEHRTSYFSTKFDPSPYSSLLGVDHIVTNKICLEYSEVNTGKSTRNGIVNISGDNITSSANEFDDFSSSERYLYLPTLTPPKLVLIKEIVNAGTLKVADAWRDAINLGDQTNIQYYSFTVSNIHLTVNGLNVLANETLKLADAFDLERPVSWIQPGISGPYIFPYVYMEEIKESFGTSYGYVAGAVYPYTLEKTYKVFNEYDPNEDKKFGMGWGDFNIAEETLEVTKFKIADGIAKNHVLIGHSHFINLLDGWDAYLERVDDLLTWSKNNNIPVKTYKEWSNTLYEQTPNPYENIFPALNIDLDKNGTPDGYEKRSSTYDGEWLNNDGVPESGNYSFSIDKVGGIFYIGRIDWDDFGLGGIEKGENEFEIWTKGAPGNFIEVVFTIGSDERIFKFPAENSEWTKYNLSQSINGHYKLNIQEYRSEIDVLVRCSNYSSGNVKISGMKLQKSSSTESYLNVNPDHLSVEPNSNNTSFSISSNVNWQIDEELDWITPSTTNGSNNADITMVINENISGSSRTGVIEVIGNSLNRTVTVIQNANELLLISPIEKEVDYNPGSFQIFITSNSEINVDESINWVSLDWNNDSITVNYQANVSKEIRTGVIYVYNNSDTSTFSITQVGLPLFTIATSIDSIGAGEVTGFGEYVLGDTVRLVAISNKDWNFLNWKEDSTIISTDSIYIFTALSSRSLVATFRTIPTGIQKFKTVPDRFHLYQNYPNPFNPITTIQFELSRTSFVQLVIHSIAGEKIRTLVDKELTAGLYKLKFDGTNLSSGTYLYNIKAGQFSQTRKLILIK